MPDLFDNFFGKISASLNGGKTTPHYGGSTQVNTGSFYSYHSNSTNNKSWMPTKDMHEAFAKMEDKNEVKPRMGSVSSMNSDEAQSRKSSVSE